jgi:hypothetical protein
MSLFDFYIMVDWSGGARRRGGRSDTIWIAHGPRIADAPLTDSPFSRTEAVRLIHSLLVNEIEAKRRVLVSLILVTAIRSISQQPFRPQLENRSSFTLAYGLAVPERAD